MVIHGKVVGPLLLAVCAVALSGCSGLPPAEASPASSVTWDIANLDHEQVDHYVERFARGEKREEFAGYLVRMPEHEAMIRSKLRARGMPEDLLFLAMVESGFNTAATSRAGAAGIWQLIPDTARRYGLRVDEEVDERRDPEKSTDAALRYLTYLYNRFGSWYLAAAAYNSGENRVGRIMLEQTGSETGTDEDYYRIRHLLPPETRDYVPAMVAAARIGKEPERYGFPPPGSAVAATTLNE